MKLSVFTPTHDATYLTEAYNSLTVQPYADWEWVLVPNGDPSPDIPIPILKDPRVKVVPYPPGEPLRIGALKRFACEHCEGDVFVELDHDDLLVPGVLPLIARGAEKAGFIFSDSAGFHSTDLRPYTYNEAYGWETYELNVYGREFVATRAFSPNARSLCEIFYAPDHVRCWRRDAYDAAGGHDVSLEVADDHDLLCRTYLADVEFVHTGTCGYLYRSHGSNTVALKNAQIQQAQAAVRDKYIHPLIDTWLVRNSLPMVDLSKDDAFRKISLPHKTSSVGCVRAYDCLQLLDPVDVANLVQEIYRILVPGGWFCLMAPATDGRAAFALGAQSYWNEFVIQTFCQSTLERYTPGLKVRFQGVRVFTSFPSDEHKAIKASYVYGDLCALKGQKQPGRVLI